jgi:hypothetical protein
VVRLTPRALAISAIPYTFTPQEYVINDDTVTIDDTTPWFVRHEVREGFSGIQSGESLTRGSPCGAGYARSPGLDDVRHPPGDDPVDVPLGA